MRDGSGTDELFACALACSVMGSNGRLLLSDSSAASRLSFDFCTGSSLSSILREVVRSGGLGRLCLKS